MPSTTQKFATQEPTTPTTPTTPATSTSPLATRATSDPVPRLGDVVARFAGTRQRALFVWAISILTAAVASVGLWIPAIAVLLVPCGAVALMIWAMPPPVVFVHQLGIVIAEGKRVRSIAWEDVAACSLVGEGRHRRLWIEKSRRDTIVIDAVRFQELDAIVGHLRGRVAIEESANGSVDFTPRG